MVLLPKIGFSALRPRMSSRKYLLDDEGEEMASRDLVVHDEVDTLLEASIFLPDPLTSARVNYGGQYRRQQ